MQRLSHALILLIALLSGYTAAVVFLQPVSSGIPIDAAGGSETAVAFYDALNRALSGGSAGPLAALLSPTFIDHDTGTGESRSAEEFLDRVRVFGQAQSVPPIAVDRIEVSGSALIVQLDRTETGSRAFAGISVEQRGNQRIVELLRVTRGRIIDRWTPGIWWLETTELEDIAVHAPGLADLANTLVRIAVPAGVVHRWNAVGTGFLLIESGSARMHAIQVDGDEETHELDRGSATSLTAGDRVQLRSVDGEPVTALVYAVMRTDPVEALPSTSARDAQGSGGVMQSVLWSGPYSHLEESTIHRPGILVLPAGTEVRLIGPASATLLVSVDADAIEIAAPGGAVSILGDDLRPVEQLNFAGIDTRRAASLTGASAVSLRNVSEHPVTIVLIDIKIDEQSGPPIG